MLEKSKNSYLNTQTFALQNLGGMWTPICPVQVSTLPCPGQRVFLEICPVLNRIGQVLPCPVNTSVHNFPKSIIAEILIKLT